MPFVGLIPKLHILRDALRSSNTLHAKRVWSAHFRNANIYNEDGWKQLHALGYLPLSIRAVPEGTIVPTKNVLLTVENTHPDFAWLTNWVETLLMQVWYPITVAAQSREIKLLLKKYLDLTGNAAGIDYMLHDFGFRGCTCPEQAAIGGAAHLTNFLGTDTAVALDYLEYYYKAEIGSDRSPAGEGVWSYDHISPGYSVPAAEHSTITSWGRNREPEAYENMLKQFPDGIIAIVGDSYNIYEACANIFGGSRLKPMILDRNGTVVIRPDSGYPPHVVVRCLDILGKKFGFEKNDKGFKVLNPKVRIIQGDGVDYDMIRNVIHAMYEAGWATENVAFGMGGALLQKLDRDTQRMALKCAETTCDGEVIEVYKDPITDQTKTSVPGRVALIKQDGVLTTVKGPHKDDVMGEVFRNGTILQYPSLSEIRERAKI